MSRNGIGADTLELEFGPVAPTGVQQVTQVVTDIARRVDNVTGIPNLAYYLGIALVGYTVYAYMSE